MDKVIQMKKNNFNKFFSLPEHIFVIITIVFGLFISMYSSPFDIPDEDTHWIKAYAISTFQLSSIDGLYAYLPSNVETFRDEIWNNDYCNISDYHAIKDITDMGNGEKFVSFRTAGYNPLLQLAPAIGILTARIFTNSLIIQFLSGRIFNLLLYCGLVYLAIKRAPKHKWTLTMIGTLPMSLMLAASYSYDALIIASSMLLFSSYLKMKYSDSNVCKTDITIYMVAGSLLIISKMVYAPMVGLLLFVSDRKFQYHFEKYIIMGLTLIIGLGVYYVWGNFGHLTTYLFHSDLVNLYHTYIGSNGTLNVPSGASVMGEVVSFIKNPIFYLRAFFATMGYYWKGYVVSAVAISFGLSISFETAVLVWVLIFIVNIFENADDHVNWLNNIYYLILFFGCVMLIFLALYSYIPPEGAGQYYSDYVRGAGIQGRYFIPCICLLLIDIPKIPLKENYRKIVIFVLFIVFIICIINILKLLL